MHSLANLLVWILLLASAVGAGYAAYRALKLPLSPGLDTLLVSAAMGLGLFIYGVAALGFLHLLRRPLILGWVILVSLLALWGYWRLWRESVRLEANLEHKAVPFVYPAWSIKSALAAFFVVYLLSTLAPPMDGDSLHSYLDIPRQYVDAGALIPLPYELHSTLPMNIQMLSAMALVVRGDELAQMLASFTMAAGCALVILALGRRYVHAEAGWLAALIFVSMRAVISLMPTAKVNLGFAFFDLLAVYTICRWAFDSRDDRWLIAGGILSGLALGAHYYAGFTGIALAVGIAIASREDGLGKLAVRLVRYGVPVVLLASPWLVKNYLWVGNPVAPVLNPLFGLPSEELKVHTRSILGLVTILWDMATGKIAKYGQPVGPVVLSILPGLLLVRPVARKVRTAVLFFAALYLLWYVGVQRPRNLLTGLGVLSLVAAYAYVELGRRSRLLRNGFIVLIAVFLLFNWADHAHQFFMTRQYQRYILGLESRDEFLQRLLDMHTYYPTGAMTRYMNGQLSSDARILAINNGFGYYIRRPYIDSRMVDGDFSHDTADDEDTLLVQWRTAGVTHIFVNEDYVGAFKQGDTSRGLAMFVLGDPGFRARCLEEVFADWNQHLYALKCGE